MHWNSPVTELTTAATDVLLAALAIWAVAVIRRLGSPEGWKVTLWSGVFGLLAVGAALGAVVHGLAWSPRMNTLLWMPLYLSLGVTVALFAAGAVLDGFGRTASRRVLPGLLAVSVLFFVATQVGNASFLWFVIYESVAMVAALAIYGYLAVAKRAPGAAMMTLGIGLSILAAAVQAGKRAHFTLLWPINHDGIFHLIQMAGVVALVVGLRQSLAASPFGERGRD
jgi:hypothetical protein